MRKYNLLLLSALVMALLGTMAFAQAKVVSAQGSEHVGIVVAYTPGQSITIVDQSGVQYEFQLASSLKMLPTKSGDSVAVGSFVTIIAPNSLSDGKQVAVGIVVHPKVPDGWKVLLPSATPLVKNTAEAPGTLPTETPKAAVTETPTVTAPSDATITPTALETSKMTPTATPLGGITTKVTNESFVQWLTSLIRQILAGQ